MDGLPWRLLCIQGPRPQALHRPSACSSGQLWPWLQTLETRVWLYTSWEQGTVSSMKTAKGIGPLSHKEPTLPLSAGRETTQ